MFDWIKDKVSGNVVKFPEPKTFPPMPEVTPPKELELDTSDAYYYLGKNKSGNTSFRMGSTTLTMTTDGVVELIERLAVMIDDSVEVTIKYIEDEQE